MKASEIICVLARNIDKYGDKRILINTGDGVFYEPSFNQTGLFEYKGKPPKNSINKPFLYFDVDLT